MTKNPFQKFIAMLAEDRRDILYLYLYALFYALVNLSLPLGVQAIVGLIQAGTVSTSWVILSALVTIGVIVGGILQVLQLSISEILQQRIFTRAAFEFTYRIPRFQNQSIRGTYPPELINRFFDTLNVQKGLSKMLMDFSASTLQIVIGLILLATTRKLTHNHTHTPHTHWLVLTCVSVIPSQASHTISTLFYKQISLIFMKTKATPSW